MYKSLDFNFDPKELLLIERNQKKQHAKDTISKELDISKEQFPRLKPHLEHKVHRFNSISCSSLSRGKAYFQRFIDPLQSGYLKQERHNQKQNRSQYIRPKRHEHEHEHAVGLGNEQLLKKLKEIEKRSNGKPLRSSLWLADEHGGEAASCEAGEGVHEERVMNYIGQL